MSGMLVPMDDHLDTAVTHISTLYELYITQRQNVVNFYLAAIALLSVAYVAALDKRHAPVVWAVCALGVFASAAAFFQDLRLRTPMERAEAALKDLQKLLAGPPLRLPSVEVQPAIQSKRRPWLSGGDQIRSVYLLVGVLFILGAIYAGQIH